MECEDWSGVGHVSSLPTREKVGRCDGQSSLSHGVGGGFGTDCQRQGCVPGSDNRLCVCEHGVHNRAS